MTQPKWMTVTGWFLTLLMTLALSMSAFMKLSANPDVLKELTEKHGYPANAVWGIGMAEAASVLLYVIPQTAGLGAILLTGYLGGAVATHVHAADNQYAGPIILGVLVWLGIYFRDARVRELFPLRKMPSRPAEIPPSAA